MSLIEIKDLTFGYDGMSVNLFEHADLRFDTQWRTALVGRNGRGKTTFFKILKGELDYSGRITGMPERVVSFPADPNAEDPEEWRVIKELNLLGTDPGILWRDPSTLSGGELTRLELAKLFAYEDGFPLIDEPTNHLDMEGRARVAEYLRAKKGFMLISHDRLFLDEATDHTIVITKNAPELYYTSFSGWWETNKIREQSEFDRNEQLKKDISRLEGARMKNRSWADRAEKSKIGIDPIKVDKSAARRPNEAAKSAKLQSLAGNIDRRITKNIAEKKTLLTNVERVEELKIRGHEYHDRIVVKNDLVTLLRGERLALTGRNGCGKTTFIREIINGLKPDVTVSYVRQDCSSMTGPIRDIARESGADVTLFNTILVKLGFPKEHLTCDAKTLSLGQKKCVALAVSLCTQADLYIWDEPLNYIDVYIREEIERLVKESDITLIFVEHDRHFTELIADKCLDMNGYLPHN